MKISQLAKTIKVPSKELFIQVAKLGIPVKSVQSAIPEKNIDKLIISLKKKFPSVNWDEIDIKVIKTESKAKSKRSAAKTKEVKKKTVKITANKEKTEKTDKKVAAVKRPKAVRGKKDSKEKLIEDKKTVEDKTVEEKAVEEKKEQPSVKEETTVEKIEEKSPEKKPAKVLKIKCPIAVKDLASKLIISPGQIIKLLMSKGVLVTINQLINEEDAKTAGEEFGYLIERLPTLEEEETFAHEEKDREEDLIPRSPVVTFMGHVDHGKTSLLDYIRKTKVTDQEKGGITQHIGAYEVSFKKGKITFLDTPGHEAFTAMRARGANVTDIVVLVIAVDDGIMPQTIEALNHARAAEVQIIVALNKVDKPNVDIDRVKKQLSEVGLMPEDWGGKTITVNVSAKTGEGIDNLLEMMLLESEMLELKANPNRPAKGVVIDAKISKGGGPIATVLVQNGTLKKGDIVVLGEYYGKIRALLNDKLYRINEAGPAMPVEILGLNGTPRAGDNFIIVSDEKTAREICQARQQKIKDEAFAPSSRKITLEELYSEIQKGKIKELNVILKADVNGSLEALADSLNKLSTKEITLKIIHKGVGEVNESDILLASASNAIVIGFHIRTTPEADKARKAEQVDVRLYSIIYEAVADIRAAMEGLLEPDIKEVVTAKIVIRQVFKLSKHGIIAGCFVQKGKVARNSYCRLIRDGGEIYKGKISSLKRFKDDVRDVSEGYECGIGLENFTSYKEGDIIEVFVVEKTARRL